MNISIRNWNSVITEHRLRNSYYICFALLIIMSEIGALEVLPPMEPAVAALQDVMGALAMIALVAIIGFRYWLVNRRRMALIYCAVALGAVFKLSSGDSTLIYIALLSGASEEARLKTIGKITFLTSICIITLSIMLFLVGVLGDASIVDSRAMFGMRLAAGFSHPNRFGMVLVSSAAGLTLWGSGSKRLSLLRCAYLLLVIILAVVIVDSRTAAIATLIPLAFELCKQVLLKRKITLWSRMILVIAIVTCLCVISCSVFYDSGNDLWIAVDTMLSKRLEFWHEYMGAYGFSIFGNNIGSGINVGGGALAVLDGAYVSAVIQFGLVGTLYLALYCLAHIWRLNETCGNIYKRENLALLTVIGMFIFVGITESYAMSPFYNILLGFSPLLVKLNIPMCCKD